MNKKNGVKLNFRASIITSAAAAATTATCKCVNRDGRDGFPSKFTDLTRASSSREKRVVVVVVVMEWGNW